MLVSKRLQIKPGCHKATLSSLCWSTMPQSSLVLIVLYNQALWHHSIVWHLFGNKPTTSCGIQAPLEPEVLIIWELCDVKISPRLCKNTQWQFRDTCWFSRHHIDSILNTAAIPIYGSIPQNWDVPRLQNQLLSQKQVDEAMEKYMDRKVSIYQPASLSLHL